MKSVLTFLSLLICIPAFSQHATIETSNPIPRVGSKLELTFTIRETDLAGSKENKTTLGEESELIATGTVQLEKALTKAGITTVGPFAFTVENQVYQTSTLTVMVYPELPPVTDGLWMKFVEVEGKASLVIEQRITNQPKREFTPTGMTYSQSSDNVKFAELKRDELRSFGLEFPNSSSLSNMQTLDMTLYPDSHFSYKRWIFNIKKTAAFSGPVKIEASLFENFPKSGVIELTEIR